MAPKHCKAYWRHFKFIKVFHFFGHFSVSPKNKQDVDRTAELKLNSDQHQDNLIKEPVILRELVYTNTIILCVCVCEYSWCFQISHSCCLFLLLSQQVGETFFYFPVFIQRVAPFRGLLLARLERWSSWHIESSPTRDSHYPSPITGEEFPPVQTSNEICGLFVIQQQSWLWSEVTKCKLNLIFHSFQFTSLPSGTTKLFGLFLLDLEF